MFDMLRLRWVIMGVVILISLISVVFLYSLKAPARAGAFTPATIRIVQGEGFREVGTALQGAGLVRSEMGFALYAVLSGTAGHFHEGTYYITAPLSVPRLAARLAASKKEITVRIPDGSTVRDVDGILAGAGVIPPGSIIALDKKEGIEGYLFPDTYQFYVDADPEDVFGKFLGNFKAKATPILLADKTNIQGNVILASLLEKEVPDYSDQQIVAGILEKRIAQGIPLQIDATVCYVKIKIREASDHCYPLSPSDFQIDSPYNTYRVKGFPPAPIGSPSVSSIQAAVHPVSSPYWYYLSDPKTGKIIFAKTLDEQSKNRAKYLK